MFDPRDAAFRSVYVDLYVDGAIATRAARTGATKAAVFHSFLEPGLQAFDDGVGLPERSDVRQTLRARLCGQAAASPSLTIIWFAERSVYGV